MNTNICRDPNKDAQKNKEATVMWPECLQGLCKIVCLFVILHKEREQLLFSKIKAEH